MIKSLFGVVLLIALLFKPLSSSFVQPHPNRCGDVEIVYPFGIGLKHSLNDDFEVTCNPKPILTKFNLQILEIEVFETWSGYVNVNMPVAKECSGGGGNSSSSKKASVNLSGSRFFIHPDMNVFASIGCEGIASLYNQSSGEKMSGCSSTCNGDSPLEVAKVEDGCHGYYCGQSEIAPRIPTNYYGKKLQRFRIGFDLLKPGSCRSAFLISDGFLNSNSSVVASIANSSFVPVVLQWNDFDFFSIQKENDVLVICTLVVSCGCFWSCWLYKTKEQRKEVKLRAKYFKGRLEQSCSNREVAYMTKLFTIKELKKATNDFSQDRVLGYGGQGIVYKGMLVDGQIIAVKKSRKFEESQWKQFINEVILLSQVNHRNVVKLLGCCLETKAPLLVYEYISNGTLSQHIHNSSSEFALPWEIRVKIASEAAWAIDYLHSSAVNPIYHRDIKSTNILLDDKFQAKVSDFGISKAISVDQTHLTTRVQGTLGYLDPEYFRSNQYSEKSDVYSFGVILVEILTGQHSIRVVTPEEEKSLIMYFISAMNNSTLDVILDPSNSKGSTKEEVMEVAKLAKRCLHARGIERPTMKEVATKLEGIMKKKSSSNPSLNQQVSFEIEEVISRSSSTLMVDEAITNPSMHDLATPHGNHDDEQPFLNTTC